MFANQNNPNGNNNTPANGYVEQQTGQWVPLYTLVVPGGAACLSPSSSPQTPGLIWRFRTFRHPHLQIHPLYKA